MKRVYSGGASRNGSRDILVSLLEPLLDFAFPIEEHLNPKHDLALSLQTENYSRGSHRASPPSPSPLAGEGGVRGNSFPRMLEVNPGIYDLAIFKSA